MRTTDEILAEMDTVQATMPELANLNSASQVAFYRLLKRMWALLVQLVEKAFDDFRVEQTALLAAKEIGTLEWYAAKVKAFQFGDAVIVRGSTATYTTIDPAKQIIKQCAVTENTSNGRLTVKAVKGATNLVPLSGDELTALKEYVRAIKYAGVAVDVVSLAADELRLNVTIKIDPQVVSNAGASLSDPAKFPIRDALQGYLKTIPFDSVLSWTLLTDYMQTVPGVKDFVVSQSFYRQAGSPTWLTFSRELVSPAGHMVLHTDSVLTYAV
ncbi:hypothetical protein ACO2Q8_07730 [Larkinella sp. VNQ87]|uniref:hypothetical protein n=1 Tax=Larkinella sp. VNQ87 TaxID=3400921 RepID=UPI003C11B024